MKTIGTVILFVIFAAVTAALASDPAPEDFAFGLPVQVQGDGAIHEITVPLQFYRGVTRSDFSDVCMFNAQQEVVPFVLRTPPATPPADPPTVSLPFFPVHGGKDQKLEGLSLQIRRNSDGTIIDLNADGDVSSERRIVAYLVDASALKRDIRALLVDWQAEPEGFVRRILVEGSDDLEHWSVCGGSTVIASLRYGDNSLTQRRMALPGTRSKYLRLSWPDRPEEVRFTGVLAELPPETPERPRNWITLEASVKQEHPGDYFFDVGGYLPADRIRVRLPQKNTLISASFFSRTAENTPWKARRSGSLYYLQIESKDLNAPGQAASPGGPGAWKGLTTGAAPGLKNEAALLQNPDLAVPPEPDRFWMMRVGRSGGGIGHGMPRLELGWLPQQLVFIARGEGPFLLAYGSGRVSGTGFQAGEMVDKFARENRDKLSYKAATAGQQIVLGGPDAAKPRTVHPWKTWVLWSVLALGVILVTWMALTLYRQMNPRKTDGE